MLSLDKHWSTKEEENLEEEDDHRKESDLDTEEKNTKVQLFKDLRRLVYKKLRRLLKMPSKLTGSPLPSMNT